MLINPHKGICLEQFKEPALSKDIVKFYAGIKKFNNPIHKKQTYSISDLINICTAANIIDDYSHQPLAHILKTAKKDKIQVIIGNAVDDDPYLSNKMTPFLKLSKDASNGMKIIAAAFNCSNIFFTIYKDIPTKTIAIPKLVNNVTVKQILAKYPIEKHSKYFIDSNNLVIGAGALIHLSRALNDNIYQSTVFLTIAGDSVPHPCNIEVGIGTPIAKIIEKFEINQNLSHIILGSSMNGKYIEDISQCFISSSSTGLLAFNSKNNFNKSYTCIRCGRCEINCPMDLDPMYIYKSISANKIDKAKYLGLSFCIGCGTCSYVCPAKQDLSNKIFNCKEQQNGI